jgi:hypothetical protein
MTPGRDLREVVHRAAALAPGGVRDHLTEMRKSALLAAVAGVSLAACSTTKEVVQRPAAPACTGGAAVWVQEGDQGHWNCPAEKVEVKVVVPN